MPKKSPLLAGLLVALVVRSTPILAAPAADDGAINLPGSFRALVVADNLVAGRMVDNFTDHLRFLAIAPNGNEVTPAQVAAQRTLP
ncbi:MAG: hypothetical protein WCR49_03175 [Opitutae bacterium]